MYLSIYLAVGPRGYFILEKTVLLVPELNKFITVYISFKLSEILFYCIDVGLDSSVLALISFLLALADVLQRYFHPILVTIYFLTELNAQI